jgi:hypothetical protein
MTDTSSAFTLDELREMSLARPNEILALLKKVGENVMASEDGADAKKKAAAVCQKILDMLDDVEKAGKVCLEESIEKEKTIAALAVVSQLRGFVKSHLPKILCPPPFFGQVLSLVMALFSGCFSKNAVPAIAPVRVALPSPPTPPVVSASPLSSDVAAVEARLVVRDPLPAAAESSVDADPAPAAVPAQQAEPDK